MKRYENFVGLTAVKKAQGNVVEVSLKLQIVQFVFNISLKNV